MNHMLSRYDVKQQDALRIDRVLRVMPFDSEFAENGTIDIRCASDIIINSNGKIVADRAGFERNDVNKDYNEYVTLRLENQAKKQLLLHFGSFVDSKQNRDRTARKEVGGGIIVLRSSSNIVNDGVLSSNGSAGGAYGGSICLCAERAVINRGEIVCRPKGRIIVRCLQFVNKGVMAPAPEVVITDGTKQREIEMVMMPWSRIGGKLQEIPLTIHQHRGHYTDDTHPGNLLGEIGFYASEYPAVGDWITFCIECPFIVVPKALVIRNYGGGYGIKSISLSLSINGLDFDEFAAILDIRNDTDEKQLFVLEKVSAVMVSNAKMWLNDYKFIKLQVDSNWGSGQNWFYSFAVVGKLFESRSEHFT